MPNDHSSLHLERKLAALATELVRKVGGYIELVPKTGVFKKRENSARSMSGGPPR